MCWREENKSVEVGRKTQCRGDKEGDVEREIMKGRNIGREGCIWEKDGVE